MTHQIALPPDQERKLDRQARLRGMDAEDYLRLLVAAALEDTPVPQQAAPDGPAVDEWLDGLEAGRDGLPVLDADALTRERLYAGHDWEALPPAMAYLLDSNVPLRLVNRRDPAYPIARHALATLARRGEEFVMAPQSMAEFWNVLTRPASARGGYGLSLADAEGVLSRLELRVRVLTEPVGLYPLWRHLVRAVGVQGVQAHDARLAAFCGAAGVAHLLSFNASDFVRYVPLIPGLAIVHPSTLWWVVASQPSLFALLGLALPALGVLVRRRVRR